MGRCFNHSSLKTLIMKQKILLSLLLLCELAISCKKDLSTQADAAGSGALASKNTNRHFKIAVVSDIHYMPPSLLGEGGAEGQAFQNYLNQDTKLVQYSDPIFRQVMSELLVEKPDVLLVPGDITKDGEKIGHHAMAGFFKTLSNSGIKVFVVPGNHDINNAKAKRFIGDKDYPVEMTSANEFADIYATFGYNDALARDAHSLSYVAK